MKSWKTPTPEQVDHAVALLVHVEQKRYFFDRLENPEWIRPLKNRGFFTNPPRAVRDDQRGTISFLQWPESRYLARMASLTPEIVLEVINDIPDDHENVHVYEDMTDAALKMPSELAAKLVSKAKIWAHSEFQLVLPEKLGALIIHLAKGGQQDDSIDLARVVLEVLPDPKTKGRTKEGDKYSLPPEPRARFDTWRYEQILKTCIPELVKPAGLSALELICDLLEAAISLSRKHDDDHGPEDYSYIWRTTIVNDEHDDIKNVLVTAVRDSAVQLAQNDISTVPTLIEVLEKRPWKVFRRIVLYILRLFQDAAPFFIKNRLTNRELFNDPCFRHEYARLIEEYFGKLPPDQQKVILSWIKKGPALERFKEVEEQWTGKRPIDEDISRYYKRWQRDRLSWFKEHLPKEWKKRYEDLVAEYGEPEYADFSSRTTTWVGPTSPKSAEALKVMSVAETIEFLKNWKPPSDNFAPSPEGLGRVLSSVVSQNPARFADEALNFKELGPTYVRSLIVGLRDALKQNRTFAWPCVLRLCQWVISQPHEIPDRYLETMSDTDPDWNLTRMAIADFLSAGFEQQAAIPVNQRTAVWTILRPLTNDPDPTPEYERQYGGSSMDPATLSINTTRGEAMHAAIKYALWIHRSIENLPNARERIDRGFDEMPEVRDVLDRHLDVSKDPSLAIRSVYGQWFPWLVLLDSSWAQVQATTIFPLGESQLSFCDTAWNSYIIFSQPYNYILDVLFDQYSLAVSRLRSPKSGRYIANPDEKLAEHIMTFYWRGKLEGKRQEVFSQFWTNAPSALRGYALRFIGRGLCSTKETVPREILGRLKLLWQRRLEVAKKTGQASEHDAEMQAFGWWFASRRFEDGWAIEQLLEALKIAGKIDADHRVVESFTELVHVMPVEVLRCLELIIKGDEKSLIIYGWYENAKQILSEVLQTEAAPAAEELVHYLGSRGYLEFRNLLRRT